MVPDSNSEFTSILRAEISRPFRLSAFKAEEKLWKPTVDTGGFTSHRPMGPWARLLEGAELLDLDLELEAMPFASRVRLKNSMGLPILLTYAHITSLSRGLRSPCRRCAYQHPFDKY